MTAKADVSPESLEGLEPVMGNLSRIEALERLASLRDRNALSEDEYEVEKAKILDS